VAGIPQLGRTRGITVATVTACLVWSGVLALRPNAGYSQTVSNIGLMLVALTAGAVALWRSTRNVGGSARAWGLLGLACLSWGLGQAVWTWYESIAGREVPFPSLADVGYLMFVPLAAVALLAFPSVPRRLSSRIRTVLDGLLIASALLFMSWMLVLGPLVQAGGDPLPLTIGLAYPAGDVVIITILLFASSHRTQGADAGRSTRPLLFAGLLAFAVADSGFVYLTNSGSYSSGSLIDIGWFCAFAAIFLAGCRASGVETDTTDDLVPDRLAVLVPYVPVGLAVFVGAFGLTFGEGIGRFLGWNMLVLILLAVIRQVAVLLENLSLTTDLEQRVRERTAELDRSERRFRSLVQNSSDVITVVDAGGTITYQSPSIERVLGRDSDALVDTSYLDLVHVDDHLALETLIDAARTRQGTNVAAELRVRTASGGWRHAEVLATSLLDDTSVNGIVLNARDVTERKELEQQLAHQAFHDPLTNLANRSLFADRLEHALQQAARRRRPLAVLYFDLDGFKSINDTLGHGAGDILLKEVAARLASCVRSGDTISRWGGDEFGILLEELATDAEANAAAERLIDVLRDPFRIGSTEVFVTASIGIVVSEVGAEACDDLLRYADLAMYRAKVERPGSYCRYEPEMQEDVKARVELDRDLRQAIERGELSVAYQPIVDLTTRSIVGVEALARWTHPTRGPVPPLEFIPVAEANGMIVEVGKFVLREACRNAAAWCRVRKDFSLSVNLSARQLHDSLVTTILEILDATGLDPSALVLEITESMLIDQSAEPLGVLQTLRQLGISLAIDDFGTGYSSLSYLHRFPVDILKVDRSFIQLLGTTQEPGLARSIVRLGDELGLRTVAEGIEYDEQLAALQHLGCTLGQGYLFAAPMHEDQISAHLVGSPVFAPAPPRAQTPPLMTTPHTAGAAPIPDAATSAKSEAAVTGSS
jgi:diguanylate cyclase (GGDEF)-like protein/PAS domain S-box-containing protein